jgi:hypothetical protein
LADHSGVMAGYSGKSLTQKLGIKPGFAVAAIDAPANCRELLRPLPEDVRFCAPSEQPRVIHYFCTEREHLAKELPRLRKSMRDDAMLWISWPKKSSPLSTTVTEDVVREFAQPLGLVDNKICAVDATRSAVRLVVRLVNRRAGAGPPP